MREKFFLAKRVLPVIIAMLFVFVNSPVTTSAISKEQRAIFNKNIGYFDYATCQIGTGAEDSSIMSNGNQSIYQSGLKEPFILEQWAIHTLKAIAQKQGIDESRTVTKEHVIALVAFALGEGGDINNTSSIFNPLNTGLNAPELIRGKQANNGTQAFKSFDAGVEATARTMMGSNQNRLAKVLSKQDSTANDFMKALTYYQRYKGNYFWAEASMPPNQDSYFSERKNLVKQVRSDYKNIASLVIGTQALEQQTGNRKPDKLVFDGGGSVPADSSGDNAGCSCTATGSDTPDSILTGKTNAEKAFNFFVQNGLSAKEAAGIVGNFMQETGGGTENLNPKLTNSTGHTGIAQWDSADRWPKLVAFAKKEGKSPRSLLVQLKFALQEPDMQRFRDSKPSTVEEATRKFDEIFERSGGSAMDKRIKYAKDIFDKYGSGLSGGSTNTSGEDCPGGPAGAFVDGDYAWPVDLKKSEVSAGYPLPCRQSSCHHDGTASFDIAHKKTVAGNADKESVGKAVFAIADGELASVGIYQGIPGCYHLQYKAKDGYVYWYGHIRKPVSQKVGKKFKVGEKIAEIGERKCTGNDSYPHLHIDRGRPKGQFGGRVCCRDQGMNDIINTLYRKLP